MTRRRPDKPRPAAGPNASWPAFDSLEARLLFSAGTEAHTAPGDEGTGHGQGCACACCAATDSQPLLAPGHTFGDGHDHGAMDADGVFFDPVSYFTGPSGLPDHATATSPAGTRSGGSFALSQVPVLHSNPGSDRVIYLDFNGMTVQGTYWNSVYHGNQAIHAPAFDLDGNVNSFNQAEIDQITEVWQRVSEDYAPFDIDVTTEEPPASAFAAGSRAIRVLISSNVDHAQLGGDGTDWYADAGGVARVGSWQYTNDTPAWVFSNLLLGSAKNVAESASHEAGHAFGLTHDGTSTGQTYYAGHGSGATSWAPIMGSAYDNAVTQWSRGEYHNSNNTQDDLAIITQTANGVDYRADDHADNRADASLIQPLFGSRSVGASGLISTGSDIDYFAFDIGSGSLHLTINPAAVGANLDIRARLYNASGSVIATSSPSSQLGASFDLTLSGGRYYVSVEGVGHGSAGSSGYSDYASLGAYHLVGSIPPMDDLALPAPLAGDADGDFTVGSSDLDAVIAYWGQTGDLPADLNGDGAVNIDDLDLLLAHWGDSAEVPTDGVSRYWVPTHGGLEQSWVQPAFDDSGWLPSVLGLGYETSGNNYAPLIATQVPAPAASVYLRSTFDVASPGGIDGLGLTIRYDDGFIAYLNGVAVASDNAELDADWNDAATDSPPDSEAERFKWFDLTAFAGLLQPGTNTLAVHLLNRSSGNNDLLLEAELVTWSDPSANRSAQPEDASDPTPVRGALAGAPVLDASAKQRDAALWAQRMGRNTPDALAASPTPAPKRGTAGTPRHVADLLRQSGGPARCWQNYEIAYAAAVNGDRRIVILFVDTDNVESYNRADARKPMAKTLQEELKKRHGFASPQQEAYLNLARTYAQLSGAVAEVLKPHGLSEATYNILRILRGVDRYPVDGRRSLACGEVADRMVTRVPDVTRLMDRLEKAGLLERVRCAADRRIVRAHISPAGKQLLRKLDKHVDRTERGLFPRLSPREVDKLSQLLAKARQPDLKND